MEDNQNKIEDFSKAAGKIVGEILTVSGDAIGLAAIKLGKEPFAYKTIKTMRNKGNSYGKNVEKFLDKNIHKVSIRLQEQDVSDLKEKAVGVYEDLKESVQKIDFAKIKEDLKEKADSVITKETHIYGDPDYFYDSKDKVEPRAEGIVIDEVTWVNEAEEQD